MLKVTTVQAYMHAHCILPLRVT